MLGLEAHEGLDAMLREESAHGWIERPIGAAHLVAFPLQQAGQRRHAAAADRNQVNRLRVVDVQARSHLTCPARRPVPAAGLAIDGTTGPR